MYTIFKKSRNPKTETSLPILFPAIVNPTQTHPHRRRYCHQALLSPVGVFTGSSAHSSKAWLQTCLFFHQRAHTEDMGAPSPVSHLTLFLGGLFASLHKHGHFLFCGCPVRHCTHVPLFISPVAYLIHVWVVSKEQFHREHCARSFPNCIHRGGMTRQRA